MGDAPVVLCASLSMDPYGKHLLRALSEVKRRRAWVAIVEGPRAVAWELGEKQWKLEGWSYGLVEYVTSEMSEALARRRRGLVIQTFSQPVEWGMALIRAEAPVPLQTLMKPLAWEEAELWVRPEKLDVRGGIPRDQMLPQAVGHCWRKEAGEREVVYGMSGPGRYRSWLRSRGVWRRC